MAIRDPPLGFLCDCVWQVLQGQCWDLLLNGCFLQICGLLIRHSLHGLVV